MMHNWIRTHERTVFLQLMMHNWIRVCVQRAVTLPLCRKCAEATYPSQPITQAECMCACVHECMCACVQKQPTHHGPSHRQSARTHEGRVQKHTRQSARTHEGRVQKHIKAQCKNTWRQSARTHEGRVQEHMEAECKNTWRQSAKTHKGNQEDSARVRGVVFAASTVLISIVVTQPCSKNRSPHN